MGNAAAKEMREKPVKDGTMTGELQKCISADCVSKKKLTLKLEDTSTGWAFRAGQAKLKDDKDKVMYHTSGYSNDAKMFTVKLVDADEKVICLACCKDVTNDQKAVVKLLRPDVPAYPDQSDFSKWAREKYSPLYPMATIELARGTGDAAAEAKYTVTREDDDGNPETLLVYTAKMISSMSGSFLMAVTNADKQLVAKVDQPKAMDTKNMTVECGAGVDIVGVTLLSVFFSVTNGSLW